MFQMMVLSPLVSILINFSQISRRDNNALSRNISVVNHAITDRKCEKMSKNVSLSRHLYNLLNVLQYRIMMIVCNVLQSSWNKSHLDH